MLWTEALGTGTFSTPTLFCLSVVLGQCLSYKITATIIIITTAASQMSLTIVESDALVIVEEEPVPLSPVLLNVFGEI